MKDINSFIGTFSLQPAVLVGNNDSPEARPGTDVPLLPKVVPLTVENVLWSNTVLAAGTAIGFVIYTGSETRAVMNTSHPETKVGLLDIEINRLAKVRYPYSFILWREFSPDQHAVRALDLMYCDIRIIRSTGGLEWLSRPLVCVRLPVSYPVFLYHPYQVCGFTPYSKLFTRNILSWSLF